jgi:hypothetical protein
MISATAMAATGKFKFVSRKVADLVPYNRNARIHSEAQIAQLAASIKEFGFTNPVLIDEQNVIVAGEGRVMAAKKLRLEEVSCVVLVGLTEAQKAAYVLADNKLALGSCWNDDLLAAELGRITDLGFDVNLSGFSEVEVLALLKEVDAAVTNMTFDAAIGTKGDAQHAVGANTSADTQASWTGMPDFHQPSDMPFRTIHVHFACQKDVDAFTKLVAKPITDKTKYLWFPEQVKVSRKGAVYA